MEENESDLRHHIENYLKTINISDYTLQISSDSTKGNNFMALVKRINVRGKNAKDENTELSFVAKTAEVNEAFRKANFINSIYKREIYTYEKILPSFFELQIRYNVPVRFESYPEYYVSSTTDFEEFVILKDMKVCGYKNCDKQHFFDFNHASLLIKELGKLHALSFALKEKEPEVFREICNNARDLEYQPGFLATSKNITDLFCIFAVKSLDPLEDRVAFDKFYHFRKKILDVTKGVICEVFDSKHAVVVHGDCWLENFLFKYQDDHVPTDVCILDWQKLRVGSPAFDISQILFLCCDKETRNNHYSDLLLAYYQSFSSFLKFFNEDANELFSFEVLLLHLKKYSVFGLARALKVIYFLAINNEDIPDISNIKDMSESVNMYLNAKRNVNLYNKVMRDMILDYISFGYNM
ncbi:hypothetical protein RN001_011085 [Aquatica leii]|uniref:CHK kinase-like domain-containing protein n=1 Tax=Aquatica leii TaxID=1421715 RepID=A0AAN7SGG6_9COLE|nr:hypothetical protein RN001_011085 [Aquatica leii]